MMMRQGWGLVAAVMLGLAARGAEEKSTLVPIAKGWAKNSVNTVVFRRNSVVTHDGRQYVGFYSENQDVMLARRTLASDEWEIRKTRYRGNAADAHRSISIMVDGEGYLHMSWDHHGGQLNYCRSVAPGSLELTEKMPMTGIKESRVTYPEFYRMSDGNLLFLYRDGSSGRGNLMMSRYDTATRKWTLVQDGFINGEGERNAYWQMCTDMRGDIHISWVWRESGNIASNHDICYAKSTDGGKTWRKTTGETYDLPITAANAEYAQRIPTSHELINTTSMCADSKGRPYIATYWRRDGAGVPQFQLIYHDGKGWNTQQISQRKTPFTLSGGGTKRIPISRCQILADNRAGVEKAYLVYRDVERGSKVTLATCEDLSKKEWTFKDLTDFAVNMWEPSYDTELWKKEKKLHIYVQEVDQGDGEQSNQSAAPTDVMILEAAL